MTPLAFADLYCGAGGATTGVLRAARRNGREIGFGVAINHWPIAVATHSANHPGVTHLCESIEQVDPCVAVPAGVLDLLWASPECTHHSRARGGKPRQNQSRSGASHVLTWLDKLYVKAVIIENVPEFAEWGPLGADGTPLKSKRGECFAAFVQSLQARNYHVEWRVLNAADYGDPTSRRRLFVLAVKRPRKVVWPEPTHRTPGDTDNLFGHAKAWRTAREIIDWSNLGTPLSQRKKPLSPNTMRRIQAGLKKFCGRPLQSCAAPRSADAPVPTIATDGAIALAQPFLVNMKGQSNSVSVDQPLPTATAHAQHLYLAQPFLVQTDQTGGRGSVTSVDEPMPTAVTKQNCGLVTPFLTAYYGSSLAQSVDEPLDSVTTKDRFLLVNPQTNERHELEIYFRLLQPGELAAAHSFPRDYRFTGNKSEVVKQIGNSNPTELTAALTRGLI